jgi:predicted AlkP superfamily pyrophosphatase or phosphodiesterase
LVRARCESGNALGRRATQADNSTAALLDRIDPAAARDAGSYRMDDDRRAAYGQALIESYGPDLLTVFFENMDATEHRYGVDTPEDRRALEHIDLLVGELVAAARRKQPNATIVVVSDHGFANSSTDINLFRAFADAGLLSLENGAVTTWDARPCGAGGSAYVVLRDPANAPVRSRVGALLAQLQRDPDNGIERVLDQGAIGRLGGWREAQYMIVFHPGYVSGRNPAAPLRATSAYRGMHGYWPADTAMYATFIINGNDVSLKGNLGVVDMRDIGPTIARLLGTRLASATGKSLF